VGFVLTSMALEYDGFSLAALAWATGAVGMFSTVTDIVIFTILNTTNKHSPELSYNTQYTRKKLGILVGSAVNIGFIMVLLQGISVADGIAVGRKHTAVHPAGTKFMAILCVIAKVLTIAADAQLLTGEARRHRRFDALVQDEEELGFHDEPFVPLVGAGAEGLGRDEVDGIDRTHVDIISHTYSVEDVES